MKKMTAAFLLFDVMAGMLLLGLFGLRNEKVATDSGMILDAGAVDNFEAKEVRKIAITFDGESIIRLSQENCLKEAVSMI